MSPGTGFIASAKLLLLFAFAGTLQIHLACGPMNTLAQHRDCDLEPDHEHEAQTKANDGCQSAICGSNSPYINAFPFNGLNTRGCINADGYALREVHVATPPSTRVPITVRATACPKAAGNPPPALYLEFASAKELPLEHQPSSPPPGYKGITGWQLVAKDDKNRAICTGEQLAGATFDVLSRDNTTTLLISHIGVTSVTYFNTEKTCAETCGKNIKDPNSVETGSCKEQCKGPQREGRYAYLVTNSKDPARSLCTKYSRQRENDPGYVDSESDQIARIYASGTKPLRGIDSDEIGAYAVIIPGTVYDHGGRQIKIKNAKEAEGWFNIACAGDGLGQSDLGGIVPSSESYSYASDAPRREALHMITAQYARGVSATVSGTPIAWKTPDRSSLRIDKSETEPLLRETQWTEDGATTIYRSRLWMNNRAIVLPVDMKKYYHMKPAEVLTIQSENDFLDRLCPRTDMHGPLPLPKSGTESSLRPALCTGDCDSSCSVERLTSYVRDHTRHCTDCAGDLSVQPEAEPHVCP